MTQRDRLVTVFGGTGFIGRYVVQRLADRGRRVRIAVRHTDPGLFLKVMGEVGQIDLVRTDIRDQAAVERAVQHAEAVVNCVGILFERGKQKFSAVHADGAGRIAAAAAQAGAKRLVHVSAIGADANSPAEYARTKAAGEAQVMQAFPTATILRPSVVFGPEDAFFNRFAAMARVSPFLPLIGGGATRFQPVYVGDVAEAVVRAMDSPDAEKRVFELAGPQTYSFRELMELVLDKTARSCALLSIPFSLAALQARILQFLPNPPLTPDQVRLLHRDNVATPGTPGLKDLGIDPSSVDGIVDTYLHRFRRPNPIPAI
jgi:NADH dehydrogenase